MTKTPNKSEAYRTLLNMFRQTYGNAAVLCLASVETGEYILTILGTDEKITLKALPLADIAVGDLVYVDANGDWVRLPGNSTATKKFLTQTGTGTASAAPAWGVVLQADVSGLSVSDSPTFVTVKLTGLTDGYIPVHTSDAVGLANGVLKTDVDSAVSLQHTQGTDQGLDTGGANAVTAAQAKAGYTHSGTDHAPSDAVSLATVKADVDVADAISKKHSVGDSIAASISDGDTTHSPDGNSVFDALALKAPLVSPSFTGQLDFTTAHGTTLLIDHIGEHTGSHGIVFDNDITRVGKLYIDHIGEATGSHRISFDDNVGIGAITPSSLYYLSLGQTSGYADPASGTSALFIDLRPQYTGTESVTENLFGFNVYLRPIVNTGHTNTGSFRGCYVEAMRNENGATGDDSGSLSYLYGFTTGYGHYNTNASATPATKNVYGLYLNPYYKTGTITNLYDIYIGADNTGGTVTNRWGIYQVTANNNFFAGSLGIGTTSFETGSTKTLNIANGTAPDAHVDDQIILYSTDSSDSTATLGLFLEQAVEDIGTFTASHKIKVKINGVEYWLQLDAV